MTVGLSNLFVDLWFYGYCIMSSTRVTLCNQEGKPFYLLYYSLINVLDSGRKLRGSRRLMLNGVEEALCSLNKL